MHQIVNLVYASSSLVLHPVQVAEWSNARVCKTLFRGFKSHPELLFQNRLIGRSTHFDCVCLGSNPSSGTKCPIDGIGIHTCLRSKVLQVRLLYRAPSWVGVIGNILVSKTKVQSSSLWPFVYPLSSVD